MTNERREQIGDKLWKMYPDDVAFIYAEYLVNEKGDRTHDYDRGLLDYSFCEMLQDKAIDDDEFIEYLENNRLYDQL